MTGPQAGGLWSPKEAQVDSRALGTALAVAFQRAGGKLKTNEAVVRIERQGGRAAVAHTPFGLYHADVFVLAAGAWKLAARGGNGVFREVVERLLRERGDWDALVKEFEIGKPEAQSI